MDLTSLAKLIPATSRLVLDGGAKPGVETDAANVAMVSVPTSTVRSGDTIQVLPGEHIPVDGIIVSGKCCVDESMLTGESMYVPWKDCNYESMLSFCIA